MPAGERVRGDQAGSAVVEFVLVCGVALTTLLGVLQFALYLYERNVLMGSLSEGARVAAANGRTVADGERVATSLVRETVGGRVAASAPIVGGDQGDLVVFRTRGVLPSFVPGVPGLPVRLQASMHKEERLEAADAG